MPAIITFFFKLQLVIVMEMGQVVLPVMIMVYAVVMLTSSMTNVMHVMLVILIFLHVKVSTKQLCIAGYPPLTQICIKTWHSV